MTSRAIASYLVAEAVLTMVKLDIAALERPAAGEAQERV